MAKLNAEIADRTLVAGSGSARAAGAAELASLKGMAGASVADLIVLGAPERRFRLFDRVFPHDQEYIFADMPCHLLMVNPSRVSTQNSERVHG